MTYGARFGECSGYWSEWQSLRLDYSEIPGLPEPLGSTLDCPWYWANVTLRNHDTSVTADPHDGETVRSSIPEACKHCRAAG